MTIEKIMNREITEATAKALADADAARNAARIRRAERVAKAWALVEWVVCITAVVGALAAFVYISIN